MFFKAFLYSCCTVGNALKFKLTAQPQMCFVNFQNIILILSTHKTFFFLIAFSDKNIVSENGKKISSKTIFVVPC